MSLGMDLVVLRSDSSYPGDTQVAVVISISLLCKESSVFKAMFSDKWNRTEKTDKAPNDDNQNVESEGDETQPTTSGQDGNSKKEQEKSKDGIDHRDVKCYKALSVKVLFDYIQGHDSMLKQCEDFDVLADMISLCDYYDMNQHVNKIKEEIKRAKISTNNVMNVMETVERFESKDISLFGSITKELEERCHQVFAEMIRATCNRIKDEKTKIGFSQPAQPQPGFGSSFQRAPQPGFGFDQQAPKPAPEDRIEKEVMDVLRFVGDITNDVLLTRLIAGIDKIIIKSLPENEVFTFDARPPPVRAAPQNSAARRINQ